MRRAILICAAIAAAWFLINLPALYERVRLDRSFVALSRYEFEPTPEIALVGSSMTFRVYEDYFKLKVRNLAIGGGSPLTGLAIIASYQTIPKLVLVEINILTRPADQALVEQFGKNDTEPFKWFRPARAVISAVYYWIKKKPIHLPESVENDISEPLTVAMKEYNSYQFDDHLDRNLAELKRLTYQLERRGCKVVFFELPYPPPLGETYLARKIRETIPTTVHFDTNLNFVDAFHVDERSAAKIARDIEQQIK